MKARLFFQILLSLGFDDVNKGKKIISTTLESSTTLKHMPYQTFNSLQKPVDSETETRYNELLSRVGSTVAAQPEFVVLLSFVVMFYSVGECGGGDGEVGERGERARVERTRDALIGQLRRVVLSKCGGDKRGATAVLLGLMSRIADLKELTAIKKRRALVERITLENPAQGGGRNDSAQ